MHDQKIRAMQPENIDRFCRIVSQILWTLLALFCCRVLGQVLVEFFGVRFLPPSKEWFSGLVPYPRLLVTQIAIILLCIKICTDLTTRRGWFHQPRNWFGNILLVFGSLYLLVMVVRYGVRMSLYPGERWTGGSIPIFFHWVLAAFVIVLGVYHQVLAKSTSDGVHRYSNSRRWLRRGAYLTAGSAVALAILLWVAYLLAPSLLAWSLGFRPSEYAVRIERSVGLQTRDGITLRADVYHPFRASDKTPTILVRLPYSKTLAQSLFATIVGRMWAERGYTVVIQGTRGRYESEGEHIPFEHEREDGIDTLRWLSQQSWYDGRVGSWGGSYFGYTQWVVSDQVDPGLSTTFVQLASSDFYRMFYPGGAFSLETALVWACVSHGETDQKVTSEMLDAGVEGLPLVRADDRAVGDVSFFNNWAMHPNRDEFWHAVDGSDRPATLQSPMLLMAGWYDPFLPTQLDDFNRIRSEADPDVARSSRLIIGPWIHADVVTFPDGVKPRHYRLESLEPSLPWFDQHLLGKASSGAPPVRLYVMGINQWRDENEWPLARTEYTSYYLHSQGNANSVLGDGLLTRAKPIGSEPPDRYIYDPREPVPTAGGAMLGPRAGIALQNAVEERQDVLVYTTDPLEAALEVTGPIRVVLYVTTTAPSTDFTAKLVDVHPDGSAYNVSDGILRRRYKPTGAVEIQIDLWPTSMVFDVGHRLRLEVSSSNYPRFDRNLNTMGATYEETEPVKASQAVFHQIDFPSRIILPVIPGSKP